VVRSDWRPRLLCNKKRVLSAWHFSTVPMRTRPRWVKRLRHIRRAETRCSRRRESIVLLRIQAVRVNLQTRCPSNLVANAFHNLRQLALTISISALIPLHQQNVIKIYDFLPFLALEPTFQLLRSHFSHTK
jgi:hypothetical protein